MTDERDSSDERSPAVTLARPVISRVQCRNYRSLEDLDLPIGALTAIVGPNGAGKTTILNALNLVLGTSWPSMRSIDVPEDFTQFDATRDMRIDVRFSPPLVGGA